MRGTGEVLAEDPPEVALGAAVRRAVVVGEVEVRDAAVERVAQDRALGRDRHVVAEVVPEAERDRRQLQAAATGAAVDRAVVAVRGGDVLVEGVHTASLVDTRRGAAPRWGAAPSEVDQVRTVWRLPIRV